MKVYLPVVHEDLTPAAREAMAPAGTETILVVEDDPSVRAVTARMLRDLGYTVLEASGGDAALRIVEEDDRPVHLLLTDVVLPGEGGRTIAERVTRRRPEVKVLFMSGYTDDITLRHRLVEEKTALLQKPFTSQTLGWRVREALDSDVVGDDTETTRSSDSRDD